MTTLLDPPRPFAAKRPRDLRPDHVIDNMPEFLLSLPHDQLTDVACRLYDDCMRLRRELDKLQGIIR